MILKWLLTAIIVFFIYKRFIQPKMVGTSEQKKREVEEKSTGKKGEYIDYEEVD